MNMSANTFYRRVREYELRHGITEPTSAWPSGERKCHTSLSEPAERNSNRWKEKALRNAYKSISEGLRLFSSNRVCACCGVPHNAYSDLCGTKNIVFGNKTR
jgi:hypothetical protein